MLIVLLYGLRFVCGNLRIEAYFGTTSIVLCRETIIIEKSEGKNPPGPAIEPGFWYKDGMIVLF